MTTGEKLSSFVTRHPHVAKFTAKLSMHHGLCGVRRTPPQPKLPLRPRMKLLLAVALSLVTTTAIFAELSGHYLARMSRARGMVFVSLVVFMGSVLS